MASDLSAYFGNIILRWLNDQADMPARPTALYLGLFNGNPKGSGTEVGGTINPSGVRQPITFADIASGAAHLLTSDLTADWGNSAGNTTISHIGLFDASSAGHLLASKALNGGATTINTGSSVKFNAGAVTFNIGSDT